MLSRSNFPLSLLLFISLHHLHLQLEPSQVVEVNEYIMGY